MKRKRETSFSWPAQPCWTEALVPDMCEEVRARVRADGDVASALALALTCRSEAALFEKRFVPCRAHDGVKHVAAHAAGSGHLALAQWAAETYGLSGSRRLLRATIIASAVKHNQVDILYAYKTRCKPRHAEELVHLQVAAALRGHLRTLVWLEQHWSLQRAHQRREEAAMPVCVCEAAAAGGALSVLDWLLLTRPLLFSTQTLTECTRAAAAHGQVETLKWLVGQGAELNAPLFDVAIARRREDVLLWLVAQNCPYHHHTLYAAANTDSLAFVQFVVTTLGCTFGTASLNPLYAAADNGNLPLVQWLYETLHCPLDLGVAESAVQGGHVHVLDWLHAHGCPLACGPLLKRAVRSGKLAVVQRVVDLVPGEDLPVHEQHMLFLSAIACGADVDMVAYLHESLHLAWSGHVVRRAYAQHKRDILVYLLQQGCPFPGAENL